MCLNDRIRPNSSGVSSGRTLTIFRRRRQRRFRHRAAASVSASRRPRRSCELRGIPNSAGAARAITLRRINNNICRKRSGRNRSRGKRDGNLIGPSRREPDAGSRRSSCTRRSYGATLEPSKNSPTGFHGGERIRGRNDPICIIISNLGGTTSLIPRARRKVRG